MEDLETGSLSLLHELLHAATVYWGSDGEIDFFLGRSLSLADVDRILRVAVGDQQYVDSNGVTQVAYGWGHCYELAQRDRSSNTDFAVYNADSLAYLATGMSICQITRILLTRSQLCILLKRTLPLALARTMIPMVSYRGLRTLVRFRTP